MQKNNLSKKTFLIIILVMFFYVTLTLAADVNKLFHHLLNIKIEFIIVALLFVISSLVIRSFRQQIFLKKINVKISFTDNTKIYLAGLTFVATPGGFGMLIKSEIIKKKFGMARSQTLPIVFIERYHDVLSILTLLIITLPFSYLWQSSIIVLIFSFIISGAYILVHRKTLLIRFQTQLSKIKFMKKIIPTQELNESFYILTKPKIMIYGWLISIISWMIEAFAVYFIFIAVGYDLEFLKTFQYYFTSLAYGAISFIPGGVGVTEGSFISLLVSNGFEFSVASTVVLIIRLTTIWFATVIGFTTTKYSFMQKTH